MFRTGLHKFWYIRLLFILLSIVIPLGLSLWIAQNYSNTTMDSDPYTLAWAVFGWLIYVIILVITMLRIEDYLLKKEKRKNISVNTVKMNEEQRNAFNETFQNFNTIFESLNNPTKTDVVKKISCPKCNCQNIAELRSKKYICLDCEHKFFVDQ